MERLKRKRSALRAQVTKLISEAHFFLESHADEGALNVLSARLSALQTQLNEVDAAIEPLVQDQDAELNYVRTIEYNDRIVAHMAKLRQEAEKDLLTKQAEMSATRAQTDGPTAGPKCKLKLPKLELQRFSGAATEWQSFWEQFEQAVHGKNGLSNAEKFLYLRSVLSGKAAAAIAGIQVTGANYTTVIELLKERFGRRDVLIQEHLTHLLDLPTVQNEKVHIGLRRLYDHLQRNNAGLTGLRVKTDSYGALLSSALLRMLPTDLVVGYHKGLSAASKDDAISIKSLQAFLKTEVESREKALQPGNLAARESKHRDREKSKPQRGSAASLFSAGTSKLSDPCAFCAAKDNATHNCQAKISLDEKKKGSLQLAGAPDAA
ncbi:uncharacterized protein [Dermacentor albipictus]|uniref:uncharacterized protein n=1 Tax=Dermacentor albipictus TaxID=60249 RepID=UPI0038FC1851